METFFAGLMGFGGVTASAMCGLEFLMSKPSETREIIAYFFFALWIVGVIGYVIASFV